MAKTQTKRPRKIEWQGYLNVNLDSSDEVAFDAWQVERAFALSDIAILVDNGYKFSLTWDDFHSGFSASLYSGNAKLAWTGWTLTAWAESVDEAIKLMFYKHYEMCLEDWERFTYKTEKSGKKRG